jgi:hypothetical protein
MREYVINVLSIGTRSLLKSQVGKLFGMRLHGRLTQRLEENIPFLY